MSEQVSPSLINMYRTLIEQEYGIIRVDDGTAANVNDILTRLADDQWNDGYQEGVSTGHKIGYDEGYAAGFSAGAASAGRG